MNSQLQMLGFDELLNIIQKTKETERRPEYLKLNEPGKA